MADHRLIADWEAWAGSREYAGLPLQVYASMPETPPAVVSVQPYGFLQRIEILFGDSSDQQPVPNMNAAEPFTFRLALPVDGIVVPIIRALRPAHGVR